MNATNNPCINQPITKSEVHGPRSEVRGPKSSASVFRFCIHTHAQILFLETDRQTDVRDPRSAIRRAMHLYLAAVSESESALKSESESAHARTHTHTHSHT